jgi:hypothetical protein
MEKDFVYIYYPRHQLYGLGEAAIYYEMIPMRLHDFP